MPRPKANVKYLPKNERGAHVKHFCHHCGAHGHTWPNCFKLQALKKTNQQNSFDFGAKKLRGKNVEFGSCGNAYQSSVFLI